MHRPAQQRASAMQLVRGEDFSAIPGVASWHFRHDRKIAERLLDQFEGGNSLFPPDPAEELATRAKQLTSFTSAQLEHALHAYESWHGESLDAESRDDLIRSARIEEVESAVLNWEEFGLEASPEALKQRLETELMRARFRRTWVPPAAQ